MADEKVVNGESNEITVAVTYNKATGKVHYDCKTDWDYAWVLMALESMKDDVKSSYREKRPVSAIMPATPGMIPKRHR